MSKAKEVKAETAHVSTNIPDMSGNVQRGVDFNLKKEDLMLLILEGRKEGMEEIIAAYQKKKQEIKAEFDKEHAAFNQEFKVKFLSSLNAEVEALAKSYGEGEKSLYVKIDSANETVTFEEFVSLAIKTSSGTAGNTFIKSQSVGNIYIGIPIKVTYQLKLTMNGKTFVKKNPLFTAEPQACRDGTDVSIKIGEQYINKEAILALKEYKALVGRAEELGRISTLLSEILTEYDLFCRNQPRAKAAMIKEVLGSDAAGKALLANITQAAKGVKLLA